MPPVLLRGQSLRPSAFCGTGIEAIKATLHAVYIEYGDSNDARTQWEEFDKYLFPKSNNSEEYVQAHRMRLPLSTILFSTSSKIVFVLRGDTRLK